jgi:RNA-directed DNA polymerase
VEKSVWTERMLTALETGVKGGKWFRLIDKVYALPNLRAAFARVKANKGKAGADHVTISQFARDLERNLGRLEAELRAETYRPQKIRRAWIRKPGKNEFRPLGIPTVRDRVAQTALRNVLEPIFEREFAAQSYGFRPNRSGKDALRRVDALLKQGYTWVVDADLKSYFDTIPHEPLMARVKERVADGRVLRLVEAYLNQKVMEGTKEWTPEAGSPQGAVISPLLSNIYLNPLDWQMARRGYEMVRYADDFVVLCRSREEAERALSEMQAWTREAGLTLHPEKTRIVNATEQPFTFLGYSFKTDRHWPSEKSLGKLKEAVRAYTPRNSGVSLQEIVRYLNPVLRGWFAYFKHVRPGWMQNLDGWVRGRLRHILRRRQKRRGMSRGRENVERPNRFFTAMGLFSLSEAHLAACQSSWR